MTDPANADPVNAEPAPTGGCACGAVRYQVNAPLRDVANCHCEPCRRTTGHHMAATAAPNAAVTIEGRESLQWWDRSPTVQYGFCRTCGSSLFWRAKDKPDHLSITAGSLDQPTGLRTTLTLYAASAGDYHQLDSSIETLAADRDLSANSTD